MYQVDARYLPQYPGKEAKINFYQACCFISIVLSVAVICLVAAVQLITDIEDWVSVGVYYLLKIVLTVTLLQASIKNQQLDCLEGTFFFLYGFFDFLIVGSFVGEMIEDKEYRKYWYIFAIKGIETLLTFIVTMTGDYRKCMMSKPKQPQFEAMPPVTLPSADAQNYGYVLVQVQP